MSKDGVEWLCKACSELKFVIEGSSHRKEGDGDENGVGVKGNKDRFVKRDCVRRVEGIWGRSSKVKRVLRVDSKVLGCMVLLVKELLA